MYMKGCLRIPFVRLLIVVCGFAVVATAAGNAAPAMARTARHTCATCGKPIDGTWFQAGNRYYHPGHFRCAWCNRPIRGEYTHYKGRDYHPGCFRSHVALWCALCGGIIRGKYITDYWGNAYHKRHEHDAPRCDSCTRFISEGLTGGGVRYDDGRYICNLCRPTSVTDIHDILALIDEVAGKLAERGIDVDYKGMTVNLIGRQKMQDLFGEHSSGLRGFTDYRENGRIFGHARGRKIVLYLLYAMPRMELVSTIAHELMHVWQYNRGRFRGDPQWREGSCNYAAWLVLERYPGESSAFFRNSLSTDPDPVYGGGFRRVRELVRKQGRKRWLSLLAHQNSFPDAN